MSLLRNRISVEPSVPADRTTTSAVTSRAASSNTSRPVSIRWKCTRQRSPARLRWWTDTFVKTFAPCATASGR